MPFTNKSIIAYVVSRNGKPLDPSELRAFLKEKFPDYMVPSAFVPLEALPLNPNGKVDRKALPAPDSSSIESDAAFIAPRDALETQLAGIWGKILNLPQVGVRDNFFEIGGHSLLAVRVFAQIEKQIGRNLPLATLFQAPTIEQLAEVLRKDGAAPRWDSLVPIQPGGMRPPLFCVHGAGGEVLFYHDVVRKLGPDQPVYALQARGLDGQSEPRTSVEEMAEAYLKEVRRVQPEGPYHLGGYSMGGRVAFEMARRLIEEGQEVAFLALFESYGPDYKIIPHESGNPYDERSFARRVGDHLRNMSDMPLGQKLDYSLQWVSKFAERVAQKRDRLANRIRLKLGDEKLVTLKRVNDANRAAARRYEPPGVYPGPVTLFVAQVKRAGRHEHDSKYGWGRWVSGAMEIQEVPGFHGIIFKDEKVEVFAERLAASLCNAQQAAARAP